MPVFMADFIDEEKEGLIQYSGVVVKNFLPVYRWVASAVFGGGRAKTDKDNDNNNMDINNTALAEDPKAVEFLLIFLFKTLLSYGRTLI